MPPLESNYIDLSIGNMHLPAAPTAVDVRKLLKTFPNGKGHSDVVLQEISFVIAPGEILGVFGPSGCGKTTLLRCLCGALPFQGQIFHYGEDITRAKAPVAYVPQNSNLLDWKTLRENALLGYDIVSGKNGGPARPTDQVDILFERFGLTTVAAAYPRRCSGGERQRAAIIRALLTPAKVVVLDEPVVAIDHITRVQIYEKVLESAEERKQLGDPFSVLMVSHDPEELLLLCDRVIVLTQRPATIKEQILVPFPHPRSSTLKFESQFVDLKKRLWATL
jgi:ABC-type nitrate/sulfonate/bicarbonate transport system ATPase subunit